MSSSVAIAVSELSKRYAFGRKPTTLREAIAYRFRHRQYMESFLALKDVSFNVVQGERVGILGRNGAGKSTLLKILSRITEPTAGTVELRGRVGSLLEVGAGFHSELTGYENVFFNGAVLGMSKSEIRSKLDSIVSFSEIGEFLHTAVKHYSSGMYTRLAFSVAAHLDSEILLIDEALSVGDTAFQSKCLNVMQDLTKTGRTVVFVSHDLAAMSKLCERIIWLHKGEVQADGPVSDVINGYLASGSTVAGTACWRMTKELTFPCKQHPIAITGVDFTDGNGKPLGDFRTGDSLNIRIEYTAVRELKRTNFSVQLRTRLGVEVFRLNTTPISGYAATEPGLSGTLDLHLPSVPLTAGTYLFDLGIGFEQTEWLDYQPGIVELDIAENDVYGSGMALDNSRGILVLPHAWKLVKKT